MRRGDVVWHVEHGVGTVVDSSRDLLAVRFTGREQWRYVNSGETLPMRDGVVVNRPERAEWRAEYGRC